MLAQRQNTHKTKVARGATFPAPTAGWYVGTNLAAAPPMTAYQLDNFFPNQDYLRLRKGSSQYAVLTGASADTVQHLFTYEAGATSKLFGTTGTAIWNVTGGGTIASADLTGQTSGDWQFVQMTTTGGVYLRGVNGSDAPQVYDGSSWSTAPAITGSGLTASDLKAVWLFRNRLYFIEKNSLSAWYLPVDSIGGTATEFPLGGVFALGGNLIAGASWSISANSGLYETCVFITDKGEVAVYDGSYPGDTAWTIKGKYLIGKPLGRDCILRTGGDLVIMTEDGMVPMSKVMTLDRIALANEAITQPIAPEWRRAVLARAGLDGWSLAVWPTESLGMVVLPQLDSNDTAQFIVNMRTGAWSRYLGWDVHCARVLNNNLYFGTSDGRVMQGETGGTDNGALYSAKMILSWDDFKAGANRKQVKAVRPVYRATVDVSPTVEVLADYAANTSPPPSASTATLSGAKWGVARWGVDKWPGTLFQKAEWKAAVGFGVVLAPTLQISVSSSTSPDFRMQQMDVLYEVGDALG